MIDCVLDDRERGGQSDSIGAAHSPGTSHSRLECTAGSLDRERSGRFSFGARREERARQPQVSAIPSQLSAASPPEPKRHSHILGSKPTALYRPYSPHTIPVALTRPHLSSLPS